MNKEFDNSVLFKQFYGSLNNEANHKGHGNEWTNDTAEATSSVIQNLKTTSAVTGTW